MTTTPLRPMKDAPDDRPVLARIRQDIHDFNEMPGPYSPGCWVVVELIAERGTWELAGPWGGDHWRSEHFDGWTRLPSDVEETAAFQPEIGQMAYGQPSHPHAVPDIMEAVLRMIGDRLDSVRWNYHQKNIPSPLSNNGPESNYDSDVFSIHAYSEPDEPQPWNFRCGEVEISWYKRAGRGMSSNVPITPNMASQILETCLAHLQKLDEAKYQKFIEGEH
jgi:hypothetical protein